MQQEFIKFLALIALVAVAICMVLAMLGTIGAVKITDGCFYRYNFNNTGSPIDVISKTVSLKAHANYTGKSTTDAQGNLTITLDPTKYGQWLNSNLVIAPGEPLNYQIRGEISLCRAYLPNNNIRQLSNLDSTGKKIPIPRVDEANTPPVSLYFDAKIDEWRNIAELYRNDKIIVSVSPEYKNTQDAAGNVTPATNVVFSDIITGNLLTANCADGQKTYDPVCGKFSIYKGPYVNGCDWDGNCWQYCHEECFYGVPIANSLCSGSSGPCWLAWCRGQVCDPRGCWQNHMGDMPEPYDGLTGRYTQNYSRILTGELIRNFQPQCNAGPLTYPAQDYNYIVNGDYLNKRFMWFSANEATGLLYRINPNEISVDIKNRGSNYDFAEIQTDQSAYNSDPKYPIIYNQNYVTGDIAYLQYRFHANDGSFTNNTGGYILNVKQTKCRRTDGSIISDSVADRGKVEYKLVPYGENPNNTGGPSYSSGVLSTGADGKGSITLPTSNHGYIWLRIYNDQNDYPDSIGEYSVHFLSSNVVGNFASLILMPILELKQKIMNAGTVIFQNMTCYQAGNTTTCTNFFNYVRVLLTMYISFQGLMFLLGMVQVNQMDLVMKIIKIIIVAGLLNERTFILFNTMVFPFVTNFCDVIIANLAGYALFTDNTGTISNPLMFMDTLMSRILFSKTFLGQLLALLSMGISGVLYFVLIFIALVITIITILRAIAVYLMAFAALAVLMGLAPLFLTFILFDSTRYLFDNWVRFTIRYMVEPVILFAGIIVLTQLFTIYLDFAIGYSVCWKCALPIKIPFPTIPLFPAIFSNIELFCLNWFAPWGLDHRSGMLGVNIQHIISLVIIAYCLYGYIDLSGKMVVKLVGGVGGPSATKMGGDMSSAFEMKAQKSVGLDPQSRKDIAGNAKQRLKNRVTAIDKHKSNLKKETKRGGGNENKEDNNTQKDE